MERITAKLIRAFVVLLLCAAVVTTASAQTAAPVPPPQYKTLGRVGPRTSPLGPPQSICESARQARARNSPAAPGLEAQCRAAYAAKGEAIAMVDPIVAKARSAEPNVAYQQGFDIATGIFGDPALGAQGNTATGPGSLGMRDALSAVGQKGFNDSVTFHLSRRGSPSPAAAERTSGAAVVSGVYADAIKTRDFRGAASVLTDRNSPYTKVGENSAGTAALLANLPFINDVQVRPDIRDVIISFTSTQKTPPLIEIGKAPPAPDQRGILAFPAGSGAFSRFVPGQNGTYSLNLGTLGEQLDIGSRYYYIINVFNDDKKNTRRSREQVKGIFNTLPQTVTVIFTEIRILPVFLAPLTGLTGSDYEFYFEVNRPSEHELGRLRHEWEIQHPGRTSQYQFPGTRHLGTPQNPLKLSLGANLIQEKVRIEWAPDELWMSVRGAIINLSPQQKPNDYFNVARGNFDMSANLGDRVSIPFTLTSRPLTPGRRVAFEIKGHIEITRHCPWPCEAR